MKKTIKQVLDGMITRREYSILQAKRKLLSMGFIRESVDNILDDYERKGYLSNQRYLDERVQSLMRRGYGPFYVKQKLQQEGVSMGSRVFDWTDAYKVAIRKAGKRKGPLLRQYLYRRGFNYENIDTCD